MHGKAYIIIPGLLLLILAGCGEKSQTIPARTVQEQLLISAAADRAMNRMDLSAVEGQRVFLDSLYFESYDKEYVIGRFRNALAFHGGRLADYREAADIIVEISSGGLSLNEGDFTIGLPSIPVAFLGTGFVTPELALFKIVRQRGIAKLSAFGYRANTREIIFSTGTQYGGTLSSSYWLLLLGPFTFSDLRSIPSESHADIMRLEYPVPPLLPPPAEADDAESSDPEPARQRAVRNPNLFQRR